MRAWKQEAGETAATGTRRVEVARPAGAAGRACKRPQDSEVGLEAEWRQRKEEKKKWNERKKKKKEKEKEKENRGLSEVGKWRERSKEEERWRDERKRELHMQ